jgi:3-deoxy-D-manno-octulosonic-acid transferase
MQFIYSALFYFLAPLILLRLLWRSIKAPAYRYRWRERFALYPQALPQHVIWFHAVSVGESEALFPLLKKIQQHHPEAKLLVTTTTPTGSARVQAVMKDTVTHVYLPYDMPDVVQRFIGHFKPTLAVIMETEIWPNLYTCCGQHHIPLYLINARLSERSARGYQKISQFVRSTLDNVSIIATQTQDDAQRFVSLGAKTDAIKVMGNIKFDISVPEITLADGHQLKNTLFANRFVWVIASTHKEEEAIFITLYQHIKLQIPELLLLLVPRHPERFIEVKRLCEQKQLKTVSRTSGEPVTQATDVYLVDTMGELKMIYAASDIAFVGGSMVPTGGHNILEAVAVGVPVLFGPYMSNFKEIARGILNQQAAIQCVDNDAIVQSVLSLYHQPNERLELVAKGQVFLKQNQGAIARIYAMLEPVIRGESI